MARNPSCARCPLHLSTRYNVCTWGCGNPSASLMLVGEALGETEDRCGVPFVGRAGQLLDHVLGKLGVLDVYITNALKCRPPDNKLPSKNAMLNMFEQCSPYLWEEVNQVQPRVVVTLGANALMCLTGRAGIGKWQGREVCDAFNAKVFAAYHPAYVLRSPSAEHELYTALWVAATAAGLTPKPKGIKHGVFDYDIM